MVEQNVMMIWMHKGGLVDLRNNLVFFTRLWIQWPGTSESHVCRDLVHSGAQLLNKEITSGLILLLCSQKFSANTCVNSAAYNSEVPLVTYRVKNPSSLFFTVFLVCLLYLQWLCHISFLLPLLMLPTIPQAAV